MIPIPWDTVRGIINDIGKVLIVIWGFKFCMCVLTEACPRFCHHCGRKAGK